MIDDRSPWDRPRLARRLVTWLREHYEWRWLLFILSIAFPFILIAILGALGVNTSGGGSP